MIFYESPYRLVKTLTQFAEFFGAEGLFPYVVRFQKFTKKCSGHIN